MADTNRKPGANTRSAASGLPRPSGSSLFDNVNAWREHNASSLPASNSSSEEDPFERGSAGRMRSTGGGDGDSNDGQKQPRRVATTPHQVRVLTAEMEINPFPDTERRAELAAELGMDRKKVQVWFQNRRQAMRGMGGRAWVTPGAYGPYYGPPASWGYPPPFPGGGYPPPGYPSYPMGPGAMGGPPPPGYPPYQQPAPWSYMPQVPHPLHPQQPHPPTAAPEPLASTTAPVPQGYPRTSSASTPATQPAAGSAGRSTIPVAGSLASQRITTRIENYGHQPRTPLTYENSADEDQKPFTGAGGPSSLLDDLAALPPEEESPFASSFAPPSSGRQRLPSLRSSMSEATLQRVTSPGLRASTPTSASRSKARDQFRVPDPLRNRSTPNYSRSSDPLASLPPPSLFNPDGRYGLPPPVPSPFGSGRSSMDLGLPPLPRRTGSLASTGPLPRLSEALGGLPPLDSSYSYGSQDNHQRPYLTPAAPTIRRRMSMESELSERDSSRVKMTPDSPSRYVDLPPLSSSSASFRRPTRPVDTRQHMSSKRSQQSPVDADLQTRSRRDSVRMAGPDDEDNGDKGTSSQGW